MYIFSHQILIRKQKRRHVLCWSNFCVTLPRRARPCKITHMQMYSVVFLFDISPTILSVDMFLTCSYRNPDRSLTSPAILSFITLSCVDPCSLCLFSFRVQWSQFKNYFLFKLEKVMDDFRASAPEQRGQVNPNVESIPFEDMKERILKIVKGYNGWVLGKSSSLRLYSSTKRCLFTYLCL